MPKKKEIHIFQTQICLVGGWPTPLKKKMSSSVGIIIPNWMEKYNMFQTTNQDILLFQLLSIINHRLTID